MVKVTHSCHGNLPYFSPDLINCVNIKIRNGTDHSHYLIGPGSRYG